MTKPTLAKQLEALNKAMFPAGSVRITFTSVVEIDLSELSGNYGSALDIGEVAQAVGDHWYDDATVTNIEVME